MTDPITIQYGPWVPDLANVPTQAQFQNGPIPVLCADCLNVFFADGVYRSLQAPANVIASSTAQPPLGAFTGTDATGNPVPIVGDAANLKALLPGGAFFSALSSSEFSAIQWQFAQFGQSVYAVDGSIVSGPGDQLVLYELDNSSFAYAGQILFNGTIASNVLTVNSVTSSPDPASQFQVGSVIAGPGIPIGTNILSLGTGTGGTGTYNITVCPNVSATAMVANVPPVGNVIGTVGQFLMLGDISFNHASVPAQYGTNALSMGTGNGATTTFNATIVNNPVRALSVTVTAGTELWTTTDNGFGLLVPTGAIVGGTINYATGQISVTFASAPHTGSPITATYTQAWPERVFWSAIGLPSFFPQPLTNAALAFQSGFEDLEGDLGPVMAIVGYPLYAVIFQRSGITRAIYQGGNVVFAFGTYEWKRGLVARSAWVQVGATVYFLSDQGWFSTDGANVTPIGTASDNSAGIDNWFWTNVNRAALSSITGGYDAHKRCIVFAIPTGSNVAPDTLLIYNIIAQRWTRAQVPTTVVWSDTDGTRHRLGIFAQFNDSTGFPYQLLTGSTLTGYLESCDLMFTDGNTRFVSGVRPNIACTDTPLVTVGTRNTLQAAVSYSPAVAPDAFGAGFAPFLVQGLYTRYRVASGAATAIHGATAELETLGPL